MSNEHLEAIRHAVIVEMVSLAKTEGQKTDLYAHAMTVMDYAEALARDLEEAQRDATLVQSHGTFVPQRWFSVHAAIVAERDRLTRGLAEADEELEQANRHWLKANARLVAAGLEPVDAEPIDDAELHALVDEMGA